MPHPPEPVSVTRPWAASSAPSFGHGRLPADEAGELHRQVVGVAVEGAQRRELAAQIRVAQLVDLLGAGEVTHPVGAEVGQAGPRRQVAGHQVGARTRQQDLAAVAEVRRRAARAAAWPEYGASPRAPASPVCRPIRSGAALVPQLALDFQGAGERFRGPSEGGQQRARLTLIRGSDAAVTAHRGTDHGIEAARVLASGAGPASNEADRNVAVPGGRAKDRLVTAALQAGRLRRPGRGVDAQPPFSTCALTSMAGHHAQGGGNDGSLHGKSDLGWMFAGAVPLIVRKPFKTEVARMNGAEK